MAKAAHSQSGDALGLDGFETHSWEKDYLADAFSVPVEIFSAGARRGRPAIYIEEKGFGRDR